MEQAPSAVSWLFRIASQSAARYAGRPRLGRVVCPTWLLVLLREGRRSMTVARQRHTSARNKPNLDATPASEMTALAVKWREAP